MNEPITFPWPFGKPIVHPWQNEQISLSAEEGTSNAPYPYYSANQFKICNLTPGAATSGLREA